MFPLCLTINTLGKTLKNSDCIDASVLKRILTALCCSLANLAQFADVIAVAQGFPLSPSSSATPVRNMYVTFVRRPTSNS